MKAILIIDMPENCYECSCCDGIGCDGIECKNQYKGYVDGWNSGRPSWCPLKPMPKKTGQKPYCRTKQECVNLGWDACIDVITGETE